MKIEKGTYGKTAEGTGVDLYTLTIPKGLRASVMTYGATLVSLEVPDRNGKMGDIVLGFDSLEGYLGKNPYFGSTVGRVANRVAKGRFKLKGVEYRLATNDGENHLHGGIKGFDKVVWNAEPIREESAVGVKFSYLSKDGEEGYPGNLTASVTYLLTPNALRISYEAVTDKATPVNLTHHSYFNLAGQGNGDILGHELTLLARRFTPAGKGLIPSGEIKSVVGTPMDFTTSAVVGSRIAQVEGGYDHNFVLDSGGGPLALAARLYDPTSGRVMEISTTEPGIQFYSGNFLDGSITGKSGKVYRKHYGLCLEAQHFPNSPNESRFPSIILEPGRKYTQVTEHSFSVR